MLSTESTSVNYSDLLGQLDCFLKHNFLFWLETQSTLGRIGHSAKMLLDLYKVCT